MLICVDISDLELGTMSVPAGAVEHGDPRRALIHVMETFQDAQDQRRRRRLGAEHADDHRDDRLVQAGLRITQRLGLELDLA